MEAWHLKQLQRTVACASHPHPLMLQASEEPNWHVQHAQVSRFSMLACT